MKRKLLLLSLLTTFGFNGLAQIPLAESDFLRAGNIKAPIFADGPLFWDRHDHTFNSPNQKKWESPKGSGKSTIFAANLWIGGQDQNNKLYLAAETFRQSFNNNGPGGVNFFYGPVADNINASFDARYNKIWKVSADEIEEHKIFFRHRNYSMPDGIAAWPAHGDVSNGEAPYLAPFVDVNQNNLFDPQNGDYPVIRGAETLYFILNDKRAIKEPNTPAMNIEIHGMAYAFDNQEDSALYNSIFINYRIINRSINDYKNVHAGIWTDFDIGFYFDDYVASDVNRNAYYGFNALPIDSVKFDLNNWNSPNPPYDQSHTYKHNPPAQGVAFLGNKQMSSFMYYTNDRHPKTGNPTTAQDHYNYLRSFWRDNTPVTFGGLGTNTNSQRYKYMFPGDSDPTGKGFSTPNTPANPWHISDHMIPQDMRGIGAFGPFNLNAGQEICFDVAFLFAQGNDHLHSVRVLKRYIDQINQFHTATYGNNCLQNQTSTNPPNRQRHAFESMFPNPATKDVTLYFDQRLTEDVTISVFDINGRKQSSKLLNKDDSAVQTINVEDLKPGVYILNLVDSGSSKKMKLVVTK